MSQIAVINRSKTLDDTTLAFAVKACSLQVEECAAAWGIAPTAVVHYRNGDVLPSECRLMTIVDDLGMASALGYHDDFLGTIYGQVLAQGPRTSQTLSHECLEELVDPTCDHWRPLPDGKRSIAVEICDPCEADTYTVEVDIMGEHRTVELSDYVLPAFFDSTSRGPFDRLGRLPSAFSMSAGGYEIIRDEGGNITNVFASTMPTRMTAKLTNPVSRTLRRMGNQGAWR